MSKPINVSRQGFEQGLHGEVLQGFVQATQVLLSIGPSKTRATAWVHAIKGQTYEMEYAAPYPDETTARGGCCTQMMLLCQV